MSKFEPKIEHFFMLLSSKETIDELRENKDYIEEFMYYTHEKQLNSVISSFINSENKDKIFNGLVSLMPLTSEIVTGIVTNTIKTISDEELLEAYNWIDKVENNLAYNLKQFFNYIEKKKIAEPYQNKVNKSTERLETLKKQFSELEEYNVKYKKNREEIKKLEKEIELLNQEQIEGYWDQKKQTLEEEKINLFNAKEQYQKDCKQLSDIQKELDDYRSGTVNKNVDKFLKTLRSLAEQLPNDEVSLK